MAVTRAWVNSGYKALAVERNFDSALDFLSDSGFCCSMLCCLYLRWGAAALAAPVCSSWIVISRGTTRRVWCAPVGDTSVKCVRDGNVMVSRLVILLYGLQALGCTWVVEQPMSSLMSMHRRWQEMYLNRLKVWSTHIYMSDYGGESAKPSLLYSPVPWLHDIQMFRERTTRGRMQSALETTVRHERADGKRTFSGGKDLKATQAYPIGFGRALFKTHQRRRLEVAAVAQMARFAFLDQEPIIDCVRHFVNEQPAKMRADAELQNLVVKLDRDIVAGVSFAA